MSLGGSAYQLQFAEQTAYGRYTVTVAESVRNIAGNAMNQNGNEILGESGDTYVGSFQIADVDLTITSVMVATEQTAGENIVISWTGENSTGYELMGSWTDGVYLSADGIWDINDIYLGGVTHTGGLAAGAEYSGNLTITLPSVKAGTYYVLVRTDINGQEAADKKSYEWVQNLEASEVVVEVEELTCNSPVRGVLDITDRYDTYKLSQAARETLRMTFDDLSAELEVYIRYEDAADATDYDRYVKVTEGNKSILLDASEAARDVYLMVRRKDGKQVEYELEVKKAETEITSVVARSFNVLEDCAFDVYGVNLDENSDFSFIDEDGVQYLPYKIEPIAGGGLRVYYPMETLPAGSLEPVLQIGTKLTRPGIITEMVSFEDKKQGDAFFAVYVDQPYSLGYHISSSFKVSYANLGYTAMDAPLVFFSVEQNGNERAFLTLDESIVNDGFWTSTVPEGFSSSVSFLATGNTGTQLMPLACLDDYEWEISMLNDATYSYSRSIDDNRFLSHFVTDSRIFSSIQRNLSSSTTIYYTGWQQPWDFSYPEFDIYVGYIDSCNTTPLDWNEMVPDEGSLINEYVVKSLQESTGTTWGDYVKGLNRQLTNLDNMGADINSVSSDELLSHMIAQALGKISPVSVLSYSTDISVQTTGLALQVSRSYANDMYSHATRSVFGHGWTHNWDIELDIQDSGDVHLNLAGVSIIFQPDYRGGYQCVSGDGYTLKKNQNGSYTLTVGQGAGDVVYEFSKNGQLTRASDANSNRISCTYDDAGQLAKLSHSNGEWIAYEYTEDGCIARLTASNGAVSVYAYEDGNLVSVTDMLGDTVSYAYSDSLEHFLTSVTGTDGTKQHFAYGDNALLESSWYEAADASATRGQSTLSYGQDGGITVTDQYGASSTYYYNLAGQVAKAIDVNGNVLRYAYDSEGNLVAMTDQKGNITSYTYDEEGNMTSVINALGKRTSYTYTATGLLSRITDANGNSMVYAYDAKGQTTSITYADGSKESWTYDQYGNIASWTTRAGKIVQMEFDARGNLLSKTVEGEGTNRFSYDAFGNVLSSTDSGGTTTYTYDERYRVSTVQYPSGHSLSYEYDSNDRMTSMTDDAGNATHYSYNEWGDLTLVTDADGNTVVSYEYDKGGRLMRETRGNGTSTSYSYTLSGDVARIEHADAQGTVGYFCEYTYDKLGLRISMQTEDGMWTYGYDVLGQLIKADFVPADGSSVAEQHITYEYDAVGNRTRTVVNGEETIYTNNTLNQTVSAGDTQYEYDVDGNLLRKTDATGSTTYRWSVEGRLLGMTTATGDVYAYTYNAAGERVSTSLNGKVTTYVYDGSGNGNLITEYDAEGNSRYYQYGNGLIGFEDALSGKYWYESDALASVTGITDSSGNLVATYAYDPFGATLCSTGSLENSLSWLGLLGLVSDDSGLTYMRARYYDEQTGTFISSDPIGVSGGLNLYAYCLNNGVSLVDTYGTRSLSNTAKYSKNLHDMGVDMVAGGISSAIKGDRESLTPVWDIARDAVGWGSDLATSLAYKKARRGFSERTLRGIGAGAATEAAGAILKVVDLGHDAYVLGSSFAPGGSLDYRDLSTWGCLAGALTDFVISGGLWIVGGMKNDKLLPEWVRDFTDWIGDSLYEDGKSVADGNRTNTGTAGSMDPNDMVGPSGYGEGNFISAGQEMPFMIRFENEEDATAPARWIRVFTTFDEAYDLNSFTLNSIYLAGNTISMAEGQDSFNKILTMTFEGQEVTVDIRINLDYDTRELKAEFMAIDPQSGSMLMDIMTGILYPNNDSGRGDGYFTYTVKLKDDLSTGTVVGNVADIYFDFNEVIPTPELNYTIDADKPESRIHSAVDMGIGGEIELTWEGTDAEGGSGVAAYYIFVQKDGGEFGLWKTFTAETTTATFAGLQGSEYGFYVLSVDNVGNVEESKTEAEITAIPTTSDETAPDKLTNLYAAAQGNYAVYVWQGVDDPSGVYYVLEYADNADMTDAVQMYTLNPYLAIEGQELGTWYWRVKAVDGVGNESEWTEGQPYLHVSADPGADDKLASATQLVMGTTTVGTTTNVAPVADWVGAGDAVDYYSITVAGDGAYRVAVDTATLETAVQVSVGVLNAQGEFEAQQELLLAPGAALDTLPGVAVEQGQTLYVKVEAVGGEQNAGGFYELSINGTVPSVGSGLATQNNSAAEATESAADGSATRGWVGAGDACDFYRVEMANAGSLSVALGELESSARVRIYEQREDGTLAQLQSIAVRGGSELDRTLNLTTGSYWVEVVSLDNGAGMHNTAYSLTLKKEEEEQQNSSSGLNLA